MFSGFMDDGGGLVKKDIRLIGLTQVGFRMIASNKSIRNYDDLKGFKIRISDSDALKLILSVQIEQYLLQ